MGEMWTDCIKAKSKDMAKCWDITTKNYAEEVPTYFLRYEDLLSNPQETLEGLFCFLLEVESVEGLNIQ